VRFNEDKIAQGSQLANKLWNASRLVLLRAGVTSSGGPNLRGAEDEIVSPDPAPRAVEDRWILSRLERAKAATAAAIEGYELHRAALGLYDFVFSELCDWYLELVKPRLYGEGEPVAGFALHVLSETLAIAHPVIPFVTEEIWAHLPHGGTGLLAQGRWPGAREDALDEQAEAQLAGVIEAIRAVRGWRDSVEAPPGAELPARRDGVGFGAEQIARMARLRWAEGDDEPVAVVAGIEILPSDAVDLQAHARRIADRRRTLEAEIARAESKLANDKFVAKAPPQVVQGERDKLARLRAELDAL
jgi:valyl-tRNA synthetase